MLPFDLPLLLFRLNNLVLRLVIWSYMILALRLLFVKIIFLLRDDLVTLPNSPAEGLVNKWHEGSVDFKVLGGRPGSLWARVRAIFTWSVECKFELAFRILMASRISLVSTVDTVLSAVGIRMRIK